MGMLLRRHLDARESARREREARDRLHASIAEDEQAAGAAEPEATPEDTGNAAPDAQQDDAAQQQPVVANTESEPADAPSHAYTDEGGEDDSDGDAPGDAPTEQRPGVGRKRRRNR